MMKHIPAAWYIVAVLAANYTAVWFFAIGPIQIAVGTLIFGAVFTLRDRMHRNGRRYVYTVIALTAFFLVLESLFLSVEARIIAASLIAILASEAADTEVYQRLLHRNWYARVATSNAVSIPLDSIIFNLIAFAGVFAWPMLISIVTGEIIVKAIASGGVALWKSSTATLPISAPRQSQ